METHIGYGTEVGTRDRIDVTPSLPPDRVWKRVDSLRSDHGTSCLGSHRDLLPGTVTLVSLTLWSTNKRLGWGSQGD